MYFCFFFGQIHLPDYEVALHNFTYMTHDMQIPHELILKWPAALSHSTSALKERYKALEALDRIQFDPTKPNFVSLERLLGTTFQEFCDTVLRMPREKVGLFLKTR